MKQDQVYLESEQCGYVVTAEIDGKELDVLYQSDWDFPSLAANLGADIVCDCGATDGTVDCEHKKADKMIAAASEWLDNHCNEILDSSPTWEIIAEYGEAS